VLWSAAAISMVVVCVEVMVMVVMVVADASWNLFAAACLVCW